MTKDSSKTCGEVLVELLQSYGIEIVFGIPGVHTVELYRGLPGPRFRLYPADAYPPRAAFSVRCLTTNSASRPTCENRPEPAVCIQCRPTK